ncbi:AbrB family transcriptional regulator [Chelativorans salis]|uniref:AbrB family transcriptional regulator n=1 Tax=Chelativorans salis TaxID=2978478 RepID=A0ABT2LQD9_9HYPH|nr:AbrB family transcriptional regulator [Chelativorans sp. EGI FJ00035]MCT7376763.1 AbrB family transcriptional regulator [Chelativorans sp. EGI FJ00035]
MDAKTFADSRARRPGPPDKSGRFRSPRWWGLVVLTYAAAVLAGAAASFVNMPLPWMLGPFFVLAAFSVAGFEFALVPLGRELGQVAIGLAVGLRFTPAVLAATASLLPAMIGATLYVIAFTMLAAFLFKPLARVDDVTAFFATAAGGVADMATVAKERGGAPGSVAVVHAMRVSGVVALVPFLVVLFGRPGGAPETAASGSSNLLLVLLALALGFLTARLLKPTPLPNPWLVGPIFTGIVIGVSGLFEVGIPSLLIVIAQIVLGTWLGCQFRRNLLSALPRVTSAAIVTSLFMIGCAALGALVLTAATGLPFTTSFLSLAPAAVTEMVLTAQVMHLEAEIVTAFHVMRIAVVSSTVLLVFRLYSTLRGGRVGPSL